jgi:CspA family cold shock protein
MPEKGKVKWFSNVKGYGFIVKKDGKDIFVHYKSIQGEGYKKLMQGEEVTFEITEGGRGPQATHVVRAPKAPKKEEAAKAEAAPAKPAAAEKKPEPEKKAAAEKKPEPEKKPEAEAEKKEAPSK